MGKAFAPPVPAHLADWIREQHLFFVATAPLAAQHHINLSPKTSSQFRLGSDGMGAKYLDLTGSGNETAAHLLENGRIVVMFMALRGSPRILRLFGAGEYVPKTRAPAGLLEGFAESDLSDVGFRGIVLIKFDRVSASCGYTIPKFEIEPVFRSTLRELTDKLGEQGIEEYRQKKNWCSIDLLPGFKALESAQTAPTKVVWEDGFPMAYDYCRHGIWRSPLTMWQKWRRRGGLRSLQEGGAGGGTGALVASAFALGVGMGLMMRR
jgi:hypothetical protein